MLTVGATTLVANCTHTPGTIGGSPGAPNPTNVAAQAAPATAFMLGTFDDDYGGKFSITESDFVQLPRGRFRIVQWNVADQYLIAQNDSLNRSDPGRWTRIDWMPLADMAPYSWAFCFSAYKAATRAEAEAASANRQTPRTGCSGFPFTRMKRTPE